MGCAARSLAPSFGPMVAPSLVVSAWAIGAGLSVIRATAATVRGFSLCAVLVYVADEYPAVYAGVGALAGVPVNVVGYGR